MTCKGKKRVCVFYMYIDERRAGDDPRVRTKHISEMGGRLLEYAVSRLYRIGVPELSRDKGKYGKPCFRIHPEVRFNISHSGDLVICAVSDFEIGIDIQEKSRMNTDRIAKKVMSPVEHKKYLESSERQDFFYRVWVMKESYVKWTGDGITRELHSLPMNGWHQFLYVDHRFASCIWAKMPLEVVVAEVRERDLNS
jgi:4'-phosphopantetheinyl transferase